MKIMVLEFLKSIQDKRGNILFLSFNGNPVNLVEIKKGFARGGHYHDFKSIHYLISGKIEFNEKNIITKKEITKIVSAPYLLPVSAKTAHMITALQDSLFIETFEQSYSATNYEPFRKIVLEKMKII